MQEFFWTMDFQTASGYTAKLQEKKSEGFQYKSQRSEVSCQEKVTADLIDIKTQKGKIVKKIKIDSVKAPVKKGQKIGEIQYSKGNIMIHKEKILAQETINKADFLTQIKKISTQYFLILSHFL